MPLYELICPHCRRPIEKLLNPNEHPPKCERCGRAMIKAVSAPARTPEKWK